MTIAFQDYLQSLPKFSRDKDQITAQHFVDFFSAIPEEKWICGQLNNCDLTENRKCCALGWLVDVANYYNNTAPYYAFERIFGSAPARLLPMLNDNPMYAPETRSPRTCVIEALSKRIGK